MRRDAAYNGCRTSCSCPADHFAGVGKMVRTGAYFCDVLLAHVASHKMDILPVLLRIALPASAKRSTWFGITIRFPLSQGEHHGKR